MRSLFIFLSFLLIESNTNLTQIELTNLSGQIEKINLAKGPKGTVLFFLSPECPLCQSYSLTINKLQKTYANKGFQFIAIIPGKEFSKESVIEFRNHYQLKGLQFWFDPKLELVKFTQASITPEAIVFNAKGQKLYQGRIDNWAYELARKRKVITAHELQDVLIQLDQKKEVKFRKTKAVGCFIN